LLGPCSRPEPQAWATVGPLSSSVNPRFRSHSARQCRLREQLSTNGAGFEGDCPTASRCRWAALCYGEMLVLRADPWSADYGMGYEAVADETPVPWADPLV